MKQAVNRIQSQNTQQYSEEEYLNAKVERYNITPGNLNEIDGYNCEY